MQYADPAERDAKIADLVSGFRRHYHTEKSLTVTTPGEKKPSGR